MMSAANRWHHAWGITDTSDGMEDGGGGDGIKGNHQVEDLTSPGRGGGFEWPQRYTSASISGVRGASGAAWKGTASSRQWSSFVGRRGFAAAAGGPTNFYDLLGVKPGVSQVCVCAWREELSSLESPPTLPSIPLYSQCFFF